MNNIQLKITLNNEEIKRYFIEMAEIQSRELLVKPDDFDCDIKMSMNAQLQEPEKLEIIFTKRVT